MYSNGESTEKQEKFKGQSEVSLKELWESGLSLSCDGFVNFTFDV